MPESATYTHKTLRDLAVLAERDGWNWAPLLTHAEAWELTDEQLDFHRDAVRQYQAEITELRGRLAAQDEWRSMARRAYSVVWSSPHSTFRTMWLSEFGPLAGGRAVDLVENTRPRGTPA